MTKRFVSILAVALSSLMVSAQLPMGTWQVHFSYNAVSQIAQSADKVYALSEGSLFSVDKHDQTIEFYSKLSGLNGTNISYIDYDAATQTLLVVYDNGIIDLMRSAGVENISDLYQKQMNSTKGVNDVFFLDGKAYLATDFGIVLINLKRNEIQNTFYIGDNASAVKLLSVVIVGTTIYASSATDIYYADIKRDNLVDYSFWKRLELPSSSSVTALEAFNGTLCALSDGKIYAYSGTAWEKKFSQRYLNNFSVSDNTIFGYTGDKVCRIYPDYSYSDIPVFAGAKQVLSDSDADLLWFAANANGLATYDFKTQVVEAFLPNGPASNSSFRMKYDDGRIISVPGSRWADRSAKPAYIMIYENGVWTNTSYEDLVNFAGQDIYDFMNVAVDPQDRNHLFATSYGCGVLEYRNMQPVKHYTPDNSSLTAAAPKYPDFYTRTDGAVFDSERNLWVLSTGAYGPNINIMTPSGQWLTTDVVSGGQRVVYNTPQEILIDSRRPSYKWIASGRDIPGLGLIDDNGTPTDFSDDRSIFRSSLHDQNNNDISIDLVFSCSQDNNGDIWLGTLSGPLRIPASTDFFTSDACQRIMIPRTDGSGLADYLLDGERINAIVADGAGRKWVGTYSSGVFLLSEDATETIEHFTTDNSPLPSNSIQSIAINPLTGEVFMGTSAGLVSYQSDANQGNEEFGNVYAYPNPVRPDYEGMITIVGLVENTQIRITDIAGNLLYETVSNGGMATWDATDGFARRVPTGVYLIQGVDSEGSSHVLTKILILN